MFYETIVHYQNYLAYYEHRLCGHRVTLKTGAEKFVPWGEKVPWSEWQIDQLLIHDLIGFPEEPFQLPPKKTVRKPTDNSQDHNFVHVDWFKAEFAWMTDKMFDGSPPGGYKFETFDDTAIMAHLIAKAGAFKSVGDARRNGWDKPIPEGYSDHIIGKRKIQVNILNKHPRMFEAGCEFIFCRCRHEHVCPFGGLK